MTAAVKFSLLLAPLASALFWESSPSPSAPARDGALGVVDNMINENKVTIFSNSKCTSSAKAKTVLEDMGVPYLAIELDQRLDGQSLKAVLAERTGAKSLPYVFVHGQHVGGAAETRRAYETGELSHWVDSHWPAPRRTSRRSSTSKRIRDDATPAAACARGRPLRRASPTPRTRARTAARTAPARRPTARRHTTATASAQGERHVPLNAKPLHAG